MSCITTFTKKRFDPISPDAQLICIEDIAHALSLLCRANGHFPIFYSVAQHCINCTYEAKARGFSNDVQLACLLHDAGEAYISDITRPIKAELPYYKEVEDKLLTVIWDKWLTKSLSKEEIEQVFSVDDAMLYHEFKTLMHEDISDGKPIIKSNPKVEFKDFLAVEKEFMKLFNKLVGKETGKVSIGIDGCKKGWICVRLENGVLEHKIYETIDHLCAENTDADVSVIDCPIGLAETSEERTFRPDKELRSRIKNTTSVFNAPLRPIVYAETLEKAWDLSRMLDGKMTPTSMAICKPIKDVDSFLQKNPEYKNKLLESHPEFCFKVLNNNQDLQFSKHKPEGLQERINVLRRYIPAIDAVIAEFDKPKLLNDFLDASCLAVMGHLGLQNGFKTIPEFPKKDNTGLLMQIVYAAI